MKNGYDLDIEKLKRIHCNHKCIKCIHREIHMYEDDTPAARTPYHWWQGICDELRIEIKHNKIPPEDCPFESKES